MNLDSDSKLSKHFMPHQIQWIQAGKAIHNQRKQAMALAEKSVRIGWTYADAFKNVRKRLWFKDRDYLFATKDYPSALEYVRQCYKFAEIFNLTSTILSHGEEYLSVNQLDDHGHPSSVVEQVKVGVIKFDNGSRIIAFSSNPQAMAVYGGDVGLDEFAKHPNAKLLWETAQGRIALGHDLAIWSAHDGEETLFNEFAQEARAACASGLLVPAGLGSWRLPDSSSSLSAGEPQSATRSQNLGHPSSGGVGNSLGQGEVASSSASSPLSAGGEGQGEVDSSSPSTTPSLHQSNNPWNLYFRVTMPDAIQLGLVDVINRARGTQLSRTQFLADCKARARQEEIYEQSYMCNPLGAATNHIVDWSVIERCRYDYTFIRVHFEHSQIIEQFGE